MFHMTDLENGRGPHPSGKNQDNSMWIPARWGYKSKQRILYGSQVKHGSTWSRHGRWLELFEEFVGNNLCAWLPVNIF